MDVAAFPGALCQQIDLQSASIDSGKITEIPADSLKNGLVIELVQYGAKSKLPASRVEDWIFLLQPSLLHIKRSTLKARIKSAYEKHKKIEHKKKVQGYKSLAEFHNDCFLFSGKQQINAETKLSSTTGCETPSTESAHPTNSQIVTELKSPSKHQYNSENQAVKSDPPPNLQTVTDLSECPSPIETETPNAPLLQSSCNFEKPVVKSDPPPDLQTVTDLSKCPRPIVGTETHSAPLFPSVSNSETPVVKIVPSPNLQTVTDISQCPSPLIETETPNVPISRANQPISDSQKFSNQLTYEISRQQKKLTVLKSLVQSDKESLKHLKAVKGHFSVRNVTKRDENAKSARQRLCSLKISYSKQKHLLETANAENRELQSRLRKYESDNMTLLSDKKRLKDVNHKKTKAQKLESYYRGILQKYRDLDQFEKIKHELKKKQDEIDWLMNENEELKDSRLNCKTKNDDGSFSNDLRLCVMELFGLEMGMEKIPSAIATVSKHLFGYKFEKKVYQRCRLLETL